MDHRLKYCFKEIESGESFVYNDTESDARFETWSFNSIEQSNLESKRGYSVPEGASSGPSSILAGALDGLTSRCSFPSKTQPLLEDPFSMNIEDPFSMNKETRQENEKGREYAFSSHTPYLNTLQVPTHLDPKDQAAVCEYLLK